MNAWQERNEKVIKEFRANNGKVDGREGLILLTTTGAKTGQPRIIPLIRVDHENQVVIVASKGGAANNPDWYHNLIAHPTVTVEVGNQKFTGTARLLTGEERERAFKRSAEVFPLYAEYQQKAPREIPLFVVAYPSHEN